MSTVSEVRNLPALAMGVERHGLTELGQHESFGLVAHLLWTNESGVDVTYIDIRVDGKEPLLVQVETDSAKDALEHPLPYAATAGFPTEQLFKREYKEA